MDTQKVRDRLGRSTTKPTFSRNAKVRDHTLRCLDTPPRSLNTIGEMHQSQVEFRLRMKLQVLERREIGVIAPIAWDWHGNPVERTLEASRDAIGDINQLGGVFWLHNRGGDRSKGCRQTELEAILSLESSGLC